MRQLQVLLFLPLGGFASTSLSVVRRHHFVKKNASLNLYFTLLQYQTLKLDSESVK
jgi:hypothetical protein